MQDNRRWQWLRGLRWNFGMDRLGGDLQQLEG
jgi:hypothetical protein